jgi:hypothetical protein
MQQKVLIIEHSKTSMGLKQALVSTAKLKPMRGPSPSNAKHIYSSSPPEEFLCAVVDYDLPDAPTVTPTILPSNHSCPPS